MSILITGLEMPTHGTFNIVYIYHDGHVSMPLWGKGTQIVEGINAIGLPLHGDLIDRDALTEQLDGIWDCNDMVFGDDNICERIHADCNSCRWRETKDYITDHIIKHAPTIIEAEEGE